MISIVVVIVHVEQIIIIHFYMQFVGIYFLYNNNNK